MLDESQVLFCIAEPRVYIRSKRVPRGVTLVFIDDRFVSEFYIKREPAEKRRLTSFYYIHCFTKYTNLNV